MSRPFRDHTDTELAAILAEPGIGDVQKKQVRAEQRYRRGEEVAPRGHEEVWPVEQEQSTGTVLIVVPWKHCVRDNAKYGVVNGRMILTRKYRRAKKAAAYDAKLQMAGRAPFTEPVALVAHIHFPNTSRKRDAGNYRKLLTDALEESVYTDDTLIHDERWIHAGVDADNPRVEIEVTLLSQEES